MAWYPDAIRKPIPPGSNDPRIDARMAILHVAVDDAASLWDFFAHRSGGIESHFYVRGSGKVEQYRDTGWQADANYHANDFAVSIETAGFGPGRWNKAQLAGIKRLLRWLHEAEGIPLVKATGPYGHGVGYHVQFGAPGPWTPHAKTCPGRRRISQYDSILVPWMQTDPADDPLEEIMGWYASKADFEKAIARAVIREGVPNYGPNRDKHPTVNLGVAIGNAREWARSAPRRTWDSPQVDMIDRPGDGGGEAGPAMRPKYALQNLWRQTVDAVRQAREDQLSPANRDRLADMVAQKIRRER